ncbi:MAG: hypothetical protein B7X86_06130 [Sphingobacteriales bacterium 17-39-43]|uniref:hypothetical protein n=1 Tax=Daejeonella sp. TaxID=2805397 RepID=UPI000BD28466|nr:hypothetical protein [Daejeonella sp.]OYZ32030.1 MAG: hypothetical protein B7Y24_06945 [Sphingobacteriales bacterium 16-39-50]OZA25334.1 MAG: hypothetical protein B7X86_06130 [Sphingobacteriales bacterium 17-39-43]HQT22578.1 hypothetical protein [Daejeonella sp.]HQT58114.1 hypothetical protein [Daejeonella sp.]
MVSKDQNISNQSLRSERRPITLKLSYLPVHVPHIADALDFVIEKLQFIPTEKFLFSESPKNDPIQLKDSNGNLLTLIMQEIKNKPEFNYIIFHTDDCLRDYHKYTLAGVEFISRPEYTDAGLRVDFLGHKENRYTLLEERIYTEI